MIVGIVILVTLAILLYFVVGFFKMRHIVETVYTVETDKLVVGNGFRIGYLSDVHYGFTVGKIRLEKIVSEINKRNADVMILGGDMFDEETTAYEMKEAANILGKLKSAKGTYYVYGNHDNGKYVNNPNFNEKDIVKELGKNNITVLDDEVRDLGAFVIIGRQDFSYGNDVTGHITQLKKKFGIKNYREVSARMDLSVLMRDVDKSKFIIEADHQPVELIQSQKEGIDLKLSGHTHGGQMWPFGIIYEMIGISEKNYGMAKIGKGSVIVSSGAGGTTMPFRTEKKSEYVVINVEGRQNGN